MNQAIERIVKMVTDQLEKNVVPWHKPWAANEAQNAVSGKEYHGWNRMILNCGQPYQDHRWLTFKQSNALGGHVMKDEHAQLVTFWKVFERSTAENDLDGDGTTHTTDARRSSQGRILRYYHIFNVEQCAGLKIKPLAEIMPVNNKAKPIDAAEALWRGYKDAPKVEQANHAFYMPSADYIGMPGIEFFETEQAFYDTLFHEGIHSTGHEKRLNRFTNQDQEHFSGRQSYAFEELVAELGAAMLAGKTGINHAEIETNNAAYCSNWLTKLKSNPEWLLKAASKAEAAANFITGA